MNDAMRTTMQAAPRHSASPRVEAIAAWLIAALILAGGGIVARLIVDYPRLLPNSYIGFLIYRAGPTIALLWACAGAALAINAETTRLMLLSALCGSLVEIGRAPLRTAVTKAQLACRHLLDKTRADE